MNKMPYSPQHKPLYTPLTPCLLHIMGMESRSVDGYRGLRDKRVEKGEMVNVKAKGRRKIRN